ncbi:glycogen debranching enzyme GlgX [Rodentibacter caecimuris]|uniref:Glycogen debranching enzyme GlgX n=2 Tax=Rodentibacter caecimuris TaxID=1796644 RepID=A0ABX3KUZ5_9PAST|nr:glycogen debranching enzyme GlgX [Rodentibacter heylii]
MKKTAIGQPFPLGAARQVLNGIIGVNFALYSSQADYIELCLFESTYLEIRIPIHQHSNHIWHIWVADVPNGTAYGFRIYGKNDRTLVNPNKLMLDPYAKAVQGKPDLSSKEAQSWFLLTDERDNAKYAPKGLIIDECFDWQGDKPLHHSWAETIIYELHIKGFTQLQKALPESIRGTYQGLAHPTTLAYLQELGITAVELLPINYFISEPHLQEKGLKNYWGYNPLAMFAVESDYAATNNPLQEFKQMVKALHQSGIEIILDVVFNHSAESERHYPTFNLRGIDESTYYWQAENGDYLNWTGCGNMLNLANETTRRWVIDCLCYWVKECHIDGFRFDLGTVLGRETPHFNPQARLFAEIARVPSLQKCKLIFEPWDMGEEGYQVGHFPHYFAEWNDRFRDDIRRFWLWKNGNLGVFAERLAGSSDIFKTPHRKPHSSINFITAHDGFTLRDLVSYNQKHNWQNREENRDGTDNNSSYNHGIEGDERVNETVKQARLLSSSAILTALLFANGTPMLLAGDEFGHSQLGNNNAYCQDNEIAWLKWHDFNPTLFNFVKKIIALRKQIQSLNNDNWWTSENVDWLTPEGTPMTVENWHNQEIKALQVVLDKRWVLLINAKAEAQIFTLPNCHPEVLSAITDYTINHNQIRLWDLGCCVLKFNILIG